MTLSQFIAKLLELEEQGHGYKTVELADWNEEYAKPSERAAETISVFETVVVIGE
jgi:hypothetical protein